ncbi:helix-turn-helix domain-containing protein [Hyphomonadaceae bacterium BL14]|nr:helix-turn-helix domain-containing protein [Hyphomonadaceae bacterium BL14]
MDWGNELRAFRARNNLKQAAAADLLGVSQAYISRLEGGVQRPSNAVEARLRAILTAPEHRPVFDSFKAVVEYSPHVMYLLSLRDGALWVEAASDAALALSGALAPGAPALEVGAALDPGGTPEVCAGVNTLIERGGFEGRLTLMDVVWSAHARATAEPLHFRSTLVPVRDELGRWFIHGTTQPVTGEELKRLTKLWKGPVGVQRFGEDQRPRAPVLVD